MSARAIPVGVVPNRRGQTRFTSACTLACSSANHAGSDSSARFARIQQGARHHRDGRSARDAVALSKMNGRKFHRPSR